MMMMYYRVVFVGSLKGFFKVRHLLGLERGDLARRKGRVEPSSTPANLLHMLIGDRTQDLAIELQEGVKDNATNVQIESHANSIRGDQNLVITVGVIK